MDGVQYTEYAMLVEQRVERRRVRIQNPTTLGAPAVREVRQVVQMRIWLLAGSFNTTQWETWVDNVLRGNTTRIQADVRMGMLSELQWPEMTNHLRAGAGSLSRNDFWAMIMAIEEVMNGNPETASEILTPSGVLP